MYLERLLQINMATLAALGALLLGMGQRSEGPPLLVALAAAISIWLTDITGLFHLSRRVANVLMLLAAAVSLYELFPLGSELQTLGFVWFVIYLQVILLFQKKDDRTYWLLVMLSLLQVVVATLFSQGVWFGVLLAVYMLLGFSAMTLLLLHRQWERYRPATAPVSEPLPPERAPDADAPSKRWPLTGERVTFASLPGGAGHVGVCGDLFRRLGCLGLHTLALSVVLFFAVPRFGQHPWRGSVVGSRSLVGFSDKVALGELGQIIESREEVMRVRFSNYWTDAPQPVDGEVYLQGALLMTYHRGQWQAGSATSDVGRAFLEPPRRFPFSTFTRQKTAIEGSDQDELFFVAPYVALKPSPDIHVDVGRQRLLRSDYLRDQRFTYDLGTTAIVNRRQRPLTPASRRDSKKNAFVVPDNLPNLVKLADQWIAESGLPEGNRLARVRYLERQLAASGQYQYSLTGQARDPNIDPIEDFITQHPQGHCEYFATALTLMLRSQGIPARMVVGYKCDEWNAVGGYFLVRQLHAHTWVEAYLEPDQLPPEYLHGIDYWPWLTAGGWFRLDPTPGGVEVEQPSGWLAPFRRARDWMDFGWSNYVVELDFERQRDAIYQPIGHAVQNAWREATSPQRWRAMFGAIRATLRLDQLSSVAAGLLMASVGLLAVALLTGVAWLFWQVGQRLYGHWAGNHAGRTRRRRAEIEFYRRFETLLARQGVVREAGQTQREFAEAAGLQLAERDHEPRLTAPPSVIAEAFYRVRFGQQPLDKQQVEAVEQALGELARLGKRRFGFAQA